jgi:hypothetical protein
MDHWRLNKNASASDHSFYHLCLSEIIQLSLLLCILAFRARGTAAPPRLRAMRTPTPYLHRIVLMSIWANVGPDRPIRLAAYTGHLMLCARFRAQRAHECTLALADSPIFMASS